MTRIIELINDFKMNQEIIGRKPKYVQMCVWRLKRWQEYMKVECEVEEVEEIEPMHIKKYVQYRQQLGNEKPITLNNNIATLKVFFNYLIDEEYLEDKSNPMRRIKSLKEETYSNIRDKLILIILFDTGIRVSELCDIKEVDISMRHILIHGKGSKQRLVYISKTMRKYMRKFE